MDIKFSGMTLTIPKGIWRYGEKEAQVNDSEFKIDPPSIALVENEIIEIKDKLAPWEESTRLEQAGLANQPLLDCLVPGSIVVKSADGSLIYKENTDYLTDNVNALISRVESGNIKKGEKVSVSYKYSLERIDVLERGADEITYLKKGKEEKTCPLPPNPDDGTEALASVYLPYRTTKLTLDLIYPIGPAFSKPSKTELIKKIKTGRKNAG